MTALCNSPCLPQLNEFSCRENTTWFDKGKESNVELLTHALRKMTTVEFIDLHRI